MENERRTEYNVDMRPEEDFLSDILSASQIRATDTYETPPQIIWIDNSTIATLGNFSASTGKAKSKKTFNVSAIVAASLAVKTSTLFACANTLRPYALGSSTTPYAKEKDTDL